uniref:Beta-1,4-glucuronyltransferase 1 n=1 Tax=Phallusia mammillata TaxID=59560 RepID=A0A6F9D6R9_9ASCI|nr:N-acetyllactosaminide beta-1,3-N-acetylglucosaminyltransferase-like [Phallusia mammillata]
MQSSRKFITIVTFIITSQVVRMILESYYTNQIDVDDITIIERTLTGVSESLAADQYVVRHFYKSEGFPINDVTPYDITLVLHGSVDKLYKLIEIAEVWDGPVSMSVLAPDSDAAFVDDAIDGVRLCWNRLRHTTSFHLVFPSRAPPNMTSLGSFVYLSCKDVIRRLRIRKPRSSTSMYPHNVMRNVARRGALTNYVLHVDADVTPSKGLRQRFLEFARRNSLHENLRSSHDVYVLPVFEVRRSSYPVRTKRELLTALEDKNARVLLQEICPQCHKATDSDRWLRSITFSPADEMSISYEVQCTKGWEPYFIASRYSPLYGINFTAYGQDRLSHMCELQAKGYKFKVLNDEFLVYDGYRSKAKITQQEKRRKDESRKFHEMFAANLRRFGYTNEAYNKC